MNHMIFGIPPILSKEVGFTIPENNVRGRIHDIEEVMMTDSFISQPIEKYVNKT